MRPFRPSPAFEGYYNAVMALVNAPITPGLPPASIAMPALTDPEEHAFALTQLAPLIATVNTYRASVPVLGTTTGPSGTIAQVAALAESGDPAAQQVYEQMLWEQASSGAP